MRKLQTQDVFALARIIKATDTKNDVVAAIEAGKSENADAEKIGINFFLSLVYSCGDTSVERMFYDFIGSIAEMSANDIKTMSLDALCDTFKKIVEENSNVVDFFKKAYRLANKIQS